MKQLLIVLLICLVGLASFSNSCYATQAEDDLYKLYIQHRYKEVVKQTTILLQQEPKNVRYNLTMGRALADQQQFATAIPYLYKAAINPNFRVSKGWALNYLGKCYFALGNNIEAQAKLLECRDLNAGKDSVDDSVRYLKLFGFDDYYKDWRTQESEHFIFHFQSSLLIPDLKQFIAEREKDFVEVNQYFHSKMPKKIDAFIYTTRKDYLMTAAPPNHPVGNGGIATPEYCLTHQYFDISTFKHEMTHVITYNYHKTLKMVPLINEGIAQYFGKPYQCTLEALNREIYLDDEQKVTVLTLWRNGKGSLDDFGYCIAGPFTDYLIKTGGFDKLLLLLPNQTYENAKVIYGEQIDQMITAFDKQVNDYVAIHKHELDIKEVAVLGAFWLGEAQINTLTPQNVKTHSFFVECKFSEDSIVSKRSIGNFLEQAGDELELQITGLPVIMAKGYEGGMYSNGKQYFGFWFSISDDDFRTMKPGIPYKLVSKQQSKEYQWRITKNLTLTKPKL